MSSKETDLITQADREFIEEQAGEGWLYIEGLLRFLRREGATLEEAHRVATEETGQEEHYLSFDRARDFLAEHADRFGIKLEERNGF